MRVAHLGCDVEAEFGVVFYLLVSKLNHVGTTYKCRNENVQMNNIFDNYYKYINGRKFTMSKVATVYNEKSA